MQWLLRIQFCAYISIATCALINMHQRYLARKEYIQPTCDHCTKVVEMTPRSPDMCFFKHCISKTVVFWNFYWKYLNIMLLNSICLFFNIRYYCTNIKYSHLTQNSDPPTKSHMETTQNSGPPKKSHMETHIW